jgi:hypothetical protein
MRAALTRLCLHEWFNRQQRRNAMEIMMAAEHVQANLCHSLSKIEITMLAAGAVRANRYRNL